MKFCITALILTTAASVTAFPAPVSEAEIDALRARGVSEHDIAARFPHSGHTTASIRVRRHIDADGEVAPGHYYAVLPRDVEAHAGLAEDSAEGRAVAQHVHAVKDFIAAVLGGHMATAGNGGVAMVRRWAGAGAGAAEGEVAAAAADDDDDDEDEEVRVRQQRPARWIYRW